MKKMVIKVVVALAVLATVFIMIFACSRKACDHQWEEKTQIVGTSAKCTETIRTCSVCETKEVISSTPHDYSCTPAQPIYNDGKVTGYSQTFTCKVCGFETTRELTREEITDAGLTLPADTDPSTDVPVGTDPSTDVTDPVGTHPADTTAPGTEPGDTTTPTDPVDTSTTPVDTDAPVGTDAPSTDPPATEPADTHPAETDPVTTPADTECAHQYTTTTVAPTCTTDGYTQYVCNKCGKSYADNATGATGHSYDDWTVTKEARCDVNGVQQRVCTKCGIAQQDVIPQRGHTWDEGQMTTVPATCGDIGVCRYTCTTCGRTKTTQINGSHAFGEWEYEEYQYTITYKPGEVGYVPGHSTSVKTSHRQIRKCTKCGYTERGNTPDHYCKRGSKYHKVTTLTEGTCTTPSVMRSTCTICGWYEDYNGRKGEHLWQDEFRHLTDYTDYTNELDAQVSVCTSCGLKTVIYKLGKGWEDSTKLKYYVNCVIDEGDAYFGVPLNDTFELVEHPTWQLLRRSFFYDQNGYVVKFSYCWWYNGQRYSQEINCGPGEVEALFKQYGMVDDTGRGKYHFRICGTYVAPYKISWTG